MILPWLLPASLLIGLLTTREAWHLRKGHLKTATPGAVVLLLFVGWFPLLAWIMNNLWSQN